MGLIKAALGSAGGVLADQWREYFYCDSMDEDVLVCKGQKRTSSRNNKGNDNIISNGAVIAVNEGQCMMIVEQGQIVEFAAEAGEFTWDSSSEPSLFSGNLGDSIKETFKAINVNKEQSNLLDVRIDAAAIALTRIAYSGSQVVEYCVCVVRGDFFRFTVELK